MRPDWAIFLTEVAHKFVNFYSYFDQYYFLVKQVWLLFWKIRQLFNLTSGHTVGERQARPVSFILPAIKHSVWMLKNFQMTIA